MPSARQVTTTNVISVRTDSTVRAVADILRPRASAPCPLARHRERGDLVHRAEIGTNARQQPTIGAPHSEGRPLTRDSAMKATPPFDGRHPISDVHTVAEPVSW
jgi:hypothetical protein